MRTKKVNFENEKGEKLSARLELPANQRPHTYAVFAHCFTCSKNLTAVKNISRALSIRGIAVLRFDFTGLGESEGDFADTNFSSNIQDLIRAAEYLKDEYAAPSILVGHSLGGSAVLAAAGEIPSVKAIATIGAPASPEHVKHHFETEIDDIEEEGVAEVNIGGRSFTVKKQFIEDIREKRLKPKIRELEAALLIMHAPQDDIVEISNATQIYKAARHPKSFVSLEGADHLLSDKKDSRYTGEMIACWSERYIDLPEREKLKSEKEVVARLGEEGFTTDIAVRQHGLTADEPEEVGGNDFGPSPYELLSAGLGACTVMTMQMYARRKKWDLHEVKVHLEHYKDYAEDMERCQDSDSKVDHFERIIEMEGDLDQDQKERLLEIADKCPVHRTLKGDIKIVTTHRE
ncbi:MAG: bifunctional alpha/beta hydrolase/OsmC family protein [Saprospiraceae bacterium]|nr:bifunctional alpha/beta hydrolase/OsmC family protein [Saprospiraceae bacterium]